MFTHGKHGMSFPYGRSNRKRRQKEIYDRKIFREKVIGIVAFVVVLLLVWFFLVFCLLSRGGGQRMVGIELE